MALNDIDRKLARHLRGRQGVFIEAGANDGVLQSNTYYFEKLRGWTGLLVEPATALAARCRKNRPKAIVVQAALVASEQPGATIELHVAGLMSTVTGAMGSAAATAKHVATGLAVQGLSETSRELVPARTLSAIIDEVGLRLPIDLLSLDVEGAEPVALAGLDLDRHAPRFLCVEARDPTAIAARLEPRYRIIEVLYDGGVYQDVLYALR
ncbi:MAG: FkbM family methyltransferase [Opitutaceae bacterium]